MSRPGRRARALRGAVVGACIAATLSLVAGRSGAEPPRVAHAVASVPASCPGLSTLSAWSTGRLAAQVVVVPAQEDDLAAVAREVAAGVGGIILFGSSVPADFPAELRSIDDSARGGIAPIVMADEEGGAVQRLENVVGNVPAPRTLGATLSPAAIEALAIRVGRSMRTLGVTMDLAPVLDVDGGAGPNDRDPDGTRSFSANPATAAADGRAFALGLIAGGVVPVVKHFPGLGGATGNTDVEVASTPPISTLRAVGLVPFERAIAAGVPAVMVSDATVPGFSPIPASLSPRVIETLLDKQLGFRGLVVTDSLSAVGISARGYGLARAATLAVHAGADMVLFNASADDVASTVESITSALTAAVAARALSRARLIEAVGAIMAVRERFDLCPG